MPYGLKDIELEKLSKVFAANERIERVVLYGSRAKGNYKPFSDVDITMMGSELTHTDLNRISLAIDDLLLPYQFDISIFHTLKNEALIDHIHRVGIAIYERENEWKEYKLGEFIKVKHGFAFKGEYITTEETHNILVTPGNFHIGGGFKDDKFKYYNNDEFPSEYILKGGDIVVTMTDLSKDSDTLGYSAKIPYSKNHNYLHNQRIGLVLFINNAVCPDFIYWIMRTREYQSYIVGSASGTSIMHTSPSRIENYSCLMPPLETQRRIASILTSLDDKISLLRRENTTLEAMAETLFKQWFVEEAKEDWEEGKLGDEFNFTMGQSPSGDSFNEEGIGTPMYQGNADFGFRFPTKRVFTTQPTRFAEPNDTLISVRAPVGAQNMATEKCCIGRGVAAFRYKHNPSYYSYTYYKLKSLLEEIKQFNDNGTVFGSISKSDFENLDVVIPDKETILRFQRQVNSIDDKIKNNNNEIQTLIQTRDGLLPRLMSNEIAL